MAKTPIELAEEHGAYGDNGYHETIYAFDEAQLEAYSRALVAPYVEALTELNSLVLRQEDFNDDGDGLTLERVSKALASHRELIGDGE